MKQTAKALKQIRIESPNIKKAFDLGFERFAAKRGGVFHHKT